MKKQNPSNKLAFNKMAVLELNDNQSQDVNGGTSTVGTTSLLLITIVIDF
ncbi:class I lanthipeptide [Flavobacterium hydatis]|jgi:hypothetical protein|nr:class I lanthipeptide [Flavobacterium hydatis]